MAVRDSNEPTRIFTGNAVVFEGEALADQAGGEVDVAVSAIDNLYDAEVIVPAGHYGVIQANRRVLVCETTSGDAYCYAAPTTAPASAIAGEAGIVDSGGEIVIRSVPDAATPYAEIYDETGTAQIAQFDATNGLTLTGDFSPTGDMTLVGDLDVTGDVDITGAVGIIGNTTMTGNLDPTGDFTLVGDVDVTGDSQFTGDIDVTGDVDVTGNVLSDTYQRTTFACAADDALDDTADEWVCTGGALGITITIPDSATMPGRRVTFKKEDVAAGTVTLDMTAPETLDGVAPWILTDQYDTVTIESDGADWHMINEYRAAAVHALSHANGGAAEILPVVVDTAAATPFAVLETHRYVRGAATGGAAQVVNLYAATAAMVGRRVTVNKTDANAQNVAVTPNGAETINGAAAAHNLAAQWDSATFLCVAVGEWEIISDA